VSFLVYATVVVVVVEVEVVVVSVVVGREVNLVELIEDEISINK